jgi:hypothetical protein
MPGYDGQENADDPLVQPWYIPGWTAQAAAADSVQVTAGDLTPDGFPADLAYVNVTGSYYDLDGSPLGGFLTFLMSDNVTVTASGKTIRIPARLAGMTAQPTGYARQSWGSGIIYLERGHLAVTLLATDAEGMVTDSGDPLTYWVTEHFLGGRTYQVTVPAASDSPADISSLVVAGTASPYSYDPVSPMGSDLIPVLLPGSPQYPGRTESRVIDGGYA